jgi:hypothetical protein
VIARQVVSSVHIYLRQYAGFELERLAWAILYDLVQGEAPSD